MHTIGIVTETLGNIIEMLKQLHTSTHNPHLLLYKPAEHFPSSLGRLLECRKCNISYNTGTHALQTVHESL